MKQLPAGMILSAIGMSLIFRPCRRMQSSHRPQAMAPIAAGASA